MSRISRRRTSLRSSAASANLRPSPRHRARHPGTAGRRGDQPPRRRHRRRGRRARRRSSRRPVARAVVARHFAEGGAGAEDLARRGRAAVRRAVLAAIHLPRRRDAVAEDEDDRDADLRGIRHHREHRGPRADPATAGGGLRRVPGLRRQDPVLVLDRSEAARRSDRPRRRHPRGASRCRGRVRRHDLR